MSNQSSVEWLYQEFERIDKEFHVGSHEYNYAKNLALKISKAMHKEECITYAHDFARQMLQNRRFVTPEIIYNETFGECNQ